MGANISLIVAMTENGIIGDNNQLLWHLPNDLKHFKALTLGKSIVMGRKTYESIGKPLPQRHNIVLTQQHDLALPGCDIVHSVSEALTLAPSEGELMVIGGGEIYRLFLDTATTLYITMVHTTLPGKVSFPVIDFSAWQETAREKHVQDEKHVYDYSFITLNRILACLPQRHL